MLFVVRFHTTSDSDSSLLAVHTSACQNARLVGVDFYYTFFPIVYTREQKPKNTKRSGGVTTSLSWCPMLYGQLGLTLSLRDLHGLTYR